MSELTVIIHVNDEGHGIETTLNNLSKQQNTNFEVILIGSEEKSCISNFPYKIKYYEKQNSAIGKAYNQVIETINTPYLMFMDQNDCIDSQYIYSCIEALNTNLEVPFAVGKSFCVNPLVTQTSEEDVFSKNFIIEKGIIDLVEHPEKITVALNGAVFRTKVIQEIKFNEKAPFEFSTEMVLRTLLQFEKYYAIPQVKYEYFMPRENQFLYHLPAHDSKWYSESLQNFLIPLCNEVQTMYGKIPAFLQMYAVYYFDCRVMANQDNRNKKVLLGKDVDDYLENVRKLFLLIDDYYLLNQDQVPFIRNNPEIRCMYLRIKYKENEINYDYVNTDGEKGRTVNMYFNGNLISSLEKHRVRINVLNYFDGKIWIDGSIVSIFNHSDVSYYVTFNNKRYDINDTDAYSLTKYFGVPAYRRLTFHLELPLDETKKNQKITFYAEINNEKFQLNLLFASHWSKLSKSIRYSYWLFNNYLCHHSDGSILIKKASFSNVLKREIQFQLNLLFRHKKDDFKALGFRYLYWITRPYFKKKKIWLLLDKLYKGGDSAEYLYRYCDKNDDGVSKYYLINSDTVEYKKLKEDGYKPLKNGTLLHKLVFVNSDIVLITNSHLFPFNGYTGEASIYIRGLCNFSSMCLQHGLSVQKCAVAQRRIIDNTMMYFLASKFEFENLSHHAYGYADLDILKITGIGRYDGLKNKDKKQILLSPTWRMYNALPVVTSEGEQRGYNPQFKNSTYFQVYNRLINDEKLLQFARKYGYKIKFLLHPILSSQINDFTPNSELEVIPSVGDLSYEKILTESSLMITDYSGVQFDFAYMRKPIVYFHPEELPPHYDDGIFFYDSMGFGEICKKTTELVDLLCEYMKNGCQMKEIYQKRADDFYAYNDHQNCERIYQEILKFQKKVDADKLRNI